MPVISCEAVVGHTERHVKEELVAGARDRHVKEPAFLGKALGGAQRHVRRKGPVHEVCQVNHGPFEPLGGVDRRDDHEVLVQVR